MHRYVISQILEPYVKGNSCFPHHYHHRKPTQLVWSLLLSSARLVFYQNKHSLMPMTPWLWSRPSWLYSLWYFHSGYALSSAERKDSTLWFQFQTYHRLWQEKTLSRWYWGELSASMANRCICGTGRLVNFAVVNNLSSLTKTFQCLRDCGLSTVTGLISIVFIRKELKQNS